MFRYLKAAFFERVLLPGMGYFPLNAILVAVICILGFGHPAFWLLGLACETAYLAAVATNRRYQRTVDARDLTIQSEDADIQHKTMAEQLREPGAARLRLLQARCDRAIDLAQAQQHEDYIVNGNREALKKLSTLYLRLLVARQSLMNPDARGDESRLREQVMQLQREIEAPKLQPALRESKLATLDILNRRLANSHRREQSLAEIESDLTRIEAQVDLAVENAGMSGQPQAVSSNISLVSQLLDPEMYGSAFSTESSFDAVDAASPKNASKGAESKEAS